MLNPSYCISAALLSALQNPCGSQYQDFKSALKCVSALVDFTLMAQYRSHTPDTLSYMESYLQTFYGTKCNFRELRSLKATRAQANRQNRELRELMADQRAKEVHHTMVANCRRLADDERVERSDRRADLIRRESHFNFIVMHYLTAFASHVLHFGSISMYSTKIGELAHEVLMKDGYRRSNNNGAPRRILSHYGYQHTLGIRLQTMEALSKVEGVIVVEHRGMEMRTVSSRSTPREILKGRMKNTRTLIALCRALDIHYSNMMEKIQCFIRQTAGDEWQLPVDPAELEFLPVERFARLEIPVCDFQETDRFQIHRARCTGTNTFGNCGSRNEWVWVQSGGDANFGDLRERVVARLLALLKIRNMVSEAAAVDCRALVGILDPINGGRFHILNGHI